MVAASNITAAELASISVNFNISASTLKSWSVTEGRAAHLSWLQGAQKMLLRYPEMCDWLTSPGDPVEKGVKLGLDSDALWNVRGIPSRTLRDWSKNDKYRQRLLAVWLGVQYRILTELAASVYSSKYSQNELFDKLDQWLLWQEVNNGRARLVSAWLRDSGLIIRMLQPQAPNPPLDRGVAVSASAIAALKGVLEANRLALLESRPCVSFAYWEGDDGASYRIMRMDDDLLVLSNGMKLPLSGVSPSQLQLRHSLV